MTKSKKTLSQRKNPIILKIFPVLPPLANTIIKINTLKLQ